MNRPDNITDKIPAELLLYISLMLPPREVLAFHSCNKYLREVLKNSGGLFKKYTLYNLGVVDDLGLELKFVKDTDLSLISDDVEMEITENYYDYVQNCMEVLAMVSSQNRMPLAIEGYRTDGGVFEDNPIYEVYHTFTSATGKAYSSTLSTPMTLSGIHRPNFDKAYWETVATKLGYFKGFLTDDIAAFESKYEVLLKIFEELVLDDENIKYKIEQAIEEGKLDYPRYRLAIKAKFPNIREVQIKNKIAEDVVSLYHSFSKINQPIIKDFKRLRPVPGFDSPHMVEYDIQPLLSQHEASRYLACFNKIKVMRPINYTCPAKTFVVFAHNQPIEEYLTYKGRNLH